MPQTVSTNDTDHEETETDAIDPTDAADIQDDTDATAHADADTPALQDLGDDIEEEIKRVMVVEEPAGKSKNQVIPEHLIKAELKPEDFFDEGSI
ncbi:hypothetical protein KGQ71_03025 [Patescibacteria group bacterium]|nr:hypothetical protein [Patescibacteria group bacterium]